jgi:hypothetical protein
MCHCKADECLEHVTMLFRNEESYLNHTNYGFGPSIVTREQVTDKAGLHGASREARQVNKYLAARYLLRVPKFYSLALPDYLPIYLLITCHASTFGLVNVHTEQITWSKVLVHLPCLSACPA